MKYSYIGNVVFKINNKFSNPYVVVDEASDLNGEMMLKLLKIYNNKFTVAHSEEKQYRYLRSKFVIVKFKTLAHYMASLENKTDK